MSAHRARGGDGGEQMTERDGGARHLGKGGRVAQALARAAPIAARLTGLTSHIRVPLGGAAQHRDQTRDQRLCCLRRLLTLWITRLDHGTAACGRGGGRARGLLQPSVRIVSEGLEGRRRVVPVAKRAPERDALGAHRRCEKHSRVSSTHTLV